MSTGCESCESSKVESAAKHGTVFIRCLKTGRCVAVVPEDRAQIACVAPTPVWCPRKGGCAE